ncbi:putative bifunctional diguanylate cyclase/phosphodiesterase [Nocardioides iriomotensis]|uniref:EAL domain-containing protein n=1 Tax=Nocardioides iriomotensis TaxID=715784 RepID=A0A4Q5J949_9ACTN|nr:EAL domain-containing protein [Nocardioides iriomotensis]RYU15272.1 EAL domain-containing protein [Nocardioides iriomotensis]
MLLSGTASDRVVRVLVTVVAGLALVVTVHNLPAIRPSHTFIPWVDGWVQGSCFVLAAVLCLLRAARRDEDAWLWLWIGLGLSARALGFVTYFGWVRFVVPPVYPSLADAFWLLTPVLMMVGLVLLVRSRFSFVSAGMALDGIATALFAGGVAVALLGPTLLGRVGGAPSVVFTNLAYPVLDIALLMVVASVLAAYRWQPPLPIWALFAGVLSFVVVDTVFLAQITAGTWRPGTLLVGFTLLTNFVLAAAGFLPSRPAVRRELLPTLAVPGALALLCVTALVYAAVSDALVVASVLIGLALVVVLARTTLTFRTVVGVAAGREDRVDELTEVQSRRAFHEHLGRTLRGRSRQLPLALLIFDVDDFKAVNEALGHAHGDRVLRQVADRLLDVLRPADRLGRMSGDEFAILLEAADAEVALATAERITLAMRRPFPTAGRELDVSASVGIAVFPGDGTEPGELLQHADLAMYEAKVNRVGHSLYRPEPHRANLVRLESVERIRRAIQADEIVLHYQPIVRLDSGEVQGFEALCRWQNPDLGLVPPAGFLPLAESGGLMRLLTLNVLGQAVRQAADWRRLGHDATVAVNLSVTNLLDVAFPDQLAMLLESEGLPGQSLELELTEDLFMADPDRARGVIRDLRWLGVRMMVDDYGTGYSSLGYLRDLHEITGLKLDRSFVTHLVDDQRAAAIVESTLTLARSLDLRVVAEGVETAAARDRLADLGCELAQGYLFARPAPAAVLTFDGIEEARARPRG